MAGRRRAGRARSAARPRAPPGPSRSAPRAAPGRTRAVRAPGRHHRRHARRGARGTSRRQCRPRPCAPYASRVDAHAPQGDLLAVEPANEPPRDSPLRAAFLAADGDAFAAAIDALLEAPRMVSGALEPGRTPLGPAASGHASLVAERGLER